LRFFRRITGINTVLYYGSIIISGTSPDSRGHALIANVIIGTVNFLLTIVAMVFLDRWGRRAILIDRERRDGNRAHISGDRLECSGNLALLMLACILLYVAFFALGMGPGPWLIISRSSPQKYEVVPPSIATSTLWSGTLLVTLTFLSLVQGSEPLGNICESTACFPLFVFIFVWKMVPETKGRNTRADSNRRGASRTGFFFKTGNTSRSHLHVKALAIDFGEHTQRAVWSKTVSLLAHETIDTDCAKEPSRSAAADRDACRGLMQGRGLSLGDIAGIAIRIAALVDSRVNRVLSTDGKYEERQRHRSCEMDPRKCWLASTNRERCAHGPVGRILRWRGAWLY